MKRWSDDDREYLIENWGYISLKGISRGLGRSISSIRRMAKYLKLEQRIHSINITANRFSKIMGVDNKTVKLWIDKYELPCEIEYVKKTKRFIFIRQDLMMDWLYENRHLYDANRIEYNGLGDEPEWLYFKRKIDAKKTWASVWTIKEVILLKDCLARNLRGTIIKKYFPKRTYYSVTSKITELRKNGDIPVREGHRICNEEKKFVITLLEQGVSINEISLITERSDKSIKFFLENEKNGNNIKNIMLSNRSD